MWRLNATSRISFLQETKTAVATAMSRIAEMVSDKSLFMVLNFIKGLLNYDFFCDCLIF